MVFCVSFNLWSWVYCRTSPARHRLVIFIRWLICSWESPPSNLLKATRKPDVLALSEIRG
jgi:hypothetical protein